MGYIRKNNDIVLRLDKGEDLILNLLELARKENIKLANITGIGASSDFSVGYLDSNLKKYISHDYKTPYEMTSLMGNISLKDNEPYLHIHATFANDKEVVGGHVTKLIIGVTAEIFINIFDIDNNRIYNYNVGVNELKF